MASPPTITPECYEQLGFKLAAHGFQKRTPTYLWSLREYPQGWFLLKVDGHQIVGTYPIATDQELTAYLAAG
jgi:hypothetical protein